MTPLTKSLWRFARVVLLGAAGWLSGSARADQAPEFCQSQSIYQIVTDRFFDGDASNNNADGNYNPSGTTSVHGGDFRGLEQKLDYIKALGATAIWISPVVLNANGEFHGYAGRDFYKVDPHWGTMADLQHMVAAAHARGLLVIDDIIVNHGGDLVYSTDSGYGTFVQPPSGYTLRFRNSGKQYPPPFDLNTTNTTLAALFHNQGTIQDYNSSNQVVLGELSGLDDFRTESDFVRARMAEIYEFWIGQAGFDGFRIDTVKHVEMGFWQAWCPPVHAYAAANGRPNFFMFGECYDGSDAKCGSYTGTRSGGAFTLDSVLDYPLYFKVNSVFATASGNTKQLEDRYSAIPANYDPSAQMRLVTFLDNHDQARFLSPGNANNNTARLNVALVFLYTARGIPCLYYGTEQAFNGATDPNDREDMFAGQFEQGPSLGDNFNVTHPQFQMVARLNNFRRLYPALQIGSHVNKWNEPGGPGLFAYARRLGGTQEVFVVFNTAATSQTLTNRSTSFSPGAKIVNLFDTNEVLTVTATPEIPPIVVPGTSAKIFVAQADWQPLDPVVVSNAPAHDASSVPTYSPIVVQFSQPMDTNSVQAAFSTTPAVTGTFRWSATREVMTFTAGDRGLPGVTTLTVRVTNSAAAATGKTLFAPYEMRFKTAATSYADLVPPVVSLASPTNGAVLAGAAAVSGIAADNVGVQKVEIRLDSGPWMAAAGTSAWSYTLNSSNFLNGPHLLAARATDTAGNFSNTNQVAVQFFNVPGDYVQRLSAGNLGDVLDCAGITWWRDRAYDFGGWGYSGGTTGYMANTVTGICASMQSLYQCERYSTSTGGFYYQFDCPEGRYETTLLEAETYWNGAGKRVFNVFIQGRQVLTNYDIFAAAGGMNRPLTLVFTNSVTNAQLQVLFTPVVDNARISGLQVRRLGDLFSGNDGVADWWRLAYFGHALGQAGDLSRGGDDADGDGASNLTEFLAGTNPRDAASVFEITSVAQVGNNVQLTWPSRSNRVYQLQRREVLGGTQAWSDLGPALAGTERTLTQSLGAANGTSQFFRVRLR